MRTRTSAALSTAALNPLPSLPTSSATGEPRAGATPSSGSAGARGVSATIVNPWRFRSSRASGHGSSDANGTRSVAAMDVRTAFL